MERLEGKGIIQDSLAKEFWNKDRERWLCCRRNQWNEETVAQLL